MIPGSARVVEAGHESEGEAKNSKLHLSSLGGGSNRAVLLTCEGPKDGSRVSLGIVSQGHLL